MMADPNLPPDFNKQCQECHVITNGPADGQQPGHKVQHISADGTLLLEDFDDAHPFNVSHGVCDDCLPAFEARYRGWIEQRRAEKEAERAAQLGEEPAE